jgi:hypothetical protein
MRLRGVFLGLYLALALVASTGAALQMYLMQVQNPSLRADLCQVPGEEKQVEHSLLCGLQMAPGLPPVAEPAPPTPLPAPRERLREAPGYPSPFPETLVPRAPPFART